MADTFVSDDRMHDAADRLARKVIEMCADAVGDPNKTPPGSLPRTVVDSLYLDAEDFMFFDPRRVDEEYTRMLAVAKAIGVNPNAYADLQETKKHLGNWSGDAATAYNRQVDLMVEYCDLQELNVLEGMLHLIAAGQLAIRARADYLELAEATIAACDKEIDDSNTRNTVAQLAIGSGIVSGVLGMDAKKLLTSTLGIFVEVGTAVLGRHIEGDDADVVIDNYLRERNGMREYYSYQLRDLRSKLMTRIDDVVRDGQPLKEPLPAYCHVESPDFRYENFESTRAGDPGPIAPVTEEERKKYVEEKKAKKAQHDSEISRRLDPDRRAP